MKKIVYIIISTILLLGHGLFAQVTQLRSTTSMGAKWSSGGNYTNFGIAGQTTAATEVAGGNYTGNFGFVFYNNAQAATNAAPVAFNELTNLFITLDSKIELKGLDPEGDSIEFVVNTLPSHLTITQQGINGELIGFTPKSDLLPNTVYNDSVKFIVREIGSGLESAVATVLFQFKLADTPHYVAALDRLTNNFTVQFVDTVKNSSYSLDINYYDLSDISNPVFVPIIEAAIPQGDFTIIGDVMSYTFSVDAALHPHLFNANQVFTTVLVTSDNGYSDFSSYMIDNTSGAGKVSGTADGKFWVIGSEQTVPENKTVKLKFMALEFADFDMTNATIDILSDATRGDIGTVMQTDAQPNLITWEVPYTATEEVGGLDSLLFRVFHPGRNLFDSTYVQIEIVGVNDPPAIEDILDKQMAEDGILNVNVNYFDPDNALAITVSSNEASNIQVGELNGVITITPNPNFNGLATITVVATEQNTTEGFTVAESFNLEILTANDPPVVTTIANQQVNEDNTVNIALSATDPDSNLLLFDYFALSDNPGIANVTVTNNLLSIVPVTNASGSVVISVQADDRTGTPNSLSVSEQFTVEFVAVNDPPEISQALATQVLVQDFPGYDIDLGVNFYDAETIDADLVYSVSNNTNINVSFTGSVATISPNATYFGTEDVTFTASDGTNTVDMLVTFVVNQKSPDINVAGPLSTFNLDEDFGSLVIDVSGVFVDINNASAAFTYEVAGNSSNSYVIDNVNETITFTSATNFSGSESLLLIGTTSGKSSYTDLVLSVNAVNDIPIIENIAAQSIYEDGMVDNLLLTISDIDNTLNTLTVSAVSGNSAIVEDAGIIITQVNGYYYLSIAPLANQHGIGDITVTVSDGLLQAQTSFSLEVYGVNDLPTATGATVANATEDVNYSLQLTGLFADTDGDILTYTVENKPAWLTVANDELTGTPTNGEVGEYSMQIKATDPFGAILIETVSFSVVNVNDDPSITQPLADITILQENSFSYLYPQSTFTDVDAGDVLTYSVEKYPQWATLTNNNLSGIPQYEHIGLDTIVFKVTDVDGLSVTDTVIVTVEFTVYDVLVSVTDATLCEGETASLLASGAVDYNWYDGAGNILQAGGSKFDQPAGITTEILIEGVDASGRATPDKVSATITVIPMPAVVANTTSSAICLGEQVTLTGSAATTYIWDNDVVDNVAFAPSATTTYVLTGTKDGCSNTADITITVNSLPDVTLTQTNESISVPIAATAAYQWYDNSEMISGAASNSFTPSETGDYFVEVTSEFGCVATSETVGFIVTGLEIDNYSLEIFPNPTHDYLNVTSNGNMDQLTFVVADLSGRIFEIPVVSQGRLTRINTGLLKGGQYVLVIRSKDSSESIRFVKR